MGLFDAGPEAIELGAKEIGFVEQDGGARQKIEDTAVGAGDGSVELPAGEDGDSTGAHGGFDDLFVSGDAFAGKARVNGAEKMIAHRSFGEGKK